MTLKRVEANNQEMDVTKERDVTWLRFIPSKIIFSCLFFMKVVH
jgi:hypothetical protein